MLDASLLTRFWAKVDRSAGPDGCWPWTGSSKPGGYGRIRLTGAARGMRRATHLSIEIETGLPFPKGKLACHHCDNPSCVNPAHLFLGSHADNVADKEAKGRGAGPTRFQGDRCRQGHLLADAGIYTHLGRDGLLHRRCLRCHRENALRYFHRAGRDKREKRR